MQKYLLFILSCFISILNQAQTQQEILRAQLQPASENVYHYPNGKPENRLARASIYTNDFSNPGDWTMTNASSPAFDWEIVNLVPTSLVNQGFSSYINSTSGGNFALLNSFAQGSSANQNANLTTTNSFDCSANTTVQIRFENYHRIFYETHTLLVSNDGVNFDSYAVNTTYGAGNGNYVISPNVEEVRVNVSATAAGQSTVWLRFNYTGGDDWFWVIDDVTAEEIPAYSSLGRNFGFCDLNPTTIFGEPIEHTIMPANQIRDLKFFGEMSNVTGSIISDAQLKLEIRNSSGSLIYSDTTLSDTLPWTWRRDSLIWNSTSTIDQYDAKMIIDFDSASAVNNPYVDSVHFAVSSNTNDYFARDNNTFSLNAFWNGAGNAYILGNEFVMTDDFTINSIDVAFTNETDIGAAVCVILYEMDPNAATINDVFIPIRDNCLDGIDHVITNSDISISPNINWRHLTLSSAIILQAGKSYLAALNHYGGTEEVRIMNGGSTVFGAATVWIYDPTATTGGPWFYMTSKPMIRISNWIGGIEENSKTNLTLLQNYPNPGSDKTTINYVLETGDEVSIDIIDITGKMIFQENLGTKNPGQHSYELNTKNFASGIYYYKVSAGKENVSLKMVVEK